MLKIILGYIKSLFCSKQSSLEIELETFYKKCLTEINKSRTLADLYNSKKLITTHAQLTNKYNMVILRKRHQTLVSAWNHRYKLWKTKGY